MAQRHRAEGMNPFGFLDDAELQPGHHRARRRHAGGSDAPRRQAGAGVVPGQSGRQGGPAGNLHPTKQHPEQEINAAVAIMMAIERAMTADGGQPDLMGFLLNGMADVADQEWLTKPMRAKWRSDLEAVSAPRSGPVRHRPTTVAW